MKELFHDVRIYTDGWFALSQESECRELFMIISYLTVDRSGEIGTCFMNREHFMGINGLGMGIIGLN